MSEEELRFLSSKAFKKMKNLKFLKFYYSFEQYYPNLCKSVEYWSKVVFQNDRMYLTDKLRSFNWLGCPLKALPSNFIPKNLVELNLRYSNLEKLWEGTTHAPNLKWIILKNCPYLTKVSDLLDTPLLEKIDIYNCKNLHGFPPPVHRFNELREFNLRDCINFVSFPNNSPFPFLVSLDLSNCINLSRISNLDAPLLEKINLENCIRLREFSLPVHQHSLVSLILRGCLKLTRISDLLHAPLLQTLDIRNCKSLLNVPSPVHHFDNLRYLKMKDCENLQSFPSNIHFSSLTCLDFCGCVKLTKFPHISGNIKHLFMTNSAIDEVPSSIENLTELIQLDLAGCTRLKHISTNICKLKALSKLDLSWCTALECFPEILDTIGSLEFLDLSRTAIKGLPHSIENLSGLIQLSLKNCKNLEMLPISIYNLTSLHDLNLFGCSKLENLLGNSVTDHSNGGESATTMPPICGLSKCSLNFTNCLSLNKTAVFKIMELQINQHRDMTTKGCGTQAVRLNCFYPRSEVPGWFKPLTGGSSINIQILGHDGVNGHLIGLAACAVIEFDKCISRGYGYEKGWQVSCHHIHGNNSRLIASIPFIVANEIDSDHVAFSYSDASVLELCEIEGTNYLFEFNLSEQFVYLRYEAAQRTRNCRVKYCGVCPIYEKHNISLPSIVNETCGAAHQDFGEMSVKEQGKIRKFSDEAETIGRSNEDVMEPHLKRTCS